MADICSYFLCQGKLSQHHWSSLLQFVYVYDEFYIGLLWAVCLYLCRTWESRVHFWQKWLDYQRWSCMESEKIVQLKHNQTEQAQYWRLMKKVCKNQWIIDIFSIYGWFLLQKLNDQSWARCFKKIVSTIKITNKKVLKGKLKIIVNYQ
jgi:hypothetical protein